MIGPLRRCGFRPWSRAHSIDHFTDKQIDALHARQIPLLYDTLSPERSHRLAVTLADPLNLQATSRLSLFRGHSSPLGSLLPPTHHFLYCEPSNPSSDLLSDGTNPEHFPGGPFVRRLWAGGSVEYNTNSPLCLNPSRSGEQQSLVCLETIRNSQVRGISDRTKVLVTVERRMAQLLEDEVRSLRHTAEGDERSLMTIEDSTRDRLNRDPEETGPCGVLEKRHFVFLPAASDPMSTLNAPEKTIKRRATKAGIFEHSFTPDRTLLFRYSALTFNSHAIHLDAEYCRQTEGYRNLLIQGSLILSCLVLKLQDALWARGPRQTVVSIDYKNLAPLYCDEPIKMRGRQLGELKYEVTAESPSGGLAVRAMVQTASAHDP